MNRSGKTDSYLPFDLAQEETIADIKVSLNLIIVE
jgi:hypothetical protein